MSLQKKSVFAVQFTASGGPGPQSVSGLHVGDLVLNVYWTANGNPYASTFTDLFEPIITVADKIQQTSGGDLSTDTPLELIVLRNA